jgi:hypothetical protein
MPLSAAVLLASAVLCAALGAGAVPLATESFSYAAGELNGQSGGTGFSGAWTASPGPTQVIDPGTPLSYAVPGGGLVDGGNRALLVEGTSNGDNILFRSLASPIAADVVFVSFLFQIRSGTVGDNDFAVVWHDNAATGSHTSTPNIGLKGNEGVGGGATNDFVARIDLNGPSAYSTNIAIGQTYFVVGRLSKSTPGAANRFDRFALWIDPSAVDPTPDATSAFTGSLTSFGMLGVRSANLDADDDVLFDNVSYGTTWSDVVPVPEPDTALLLALGLAALARSSQPRSGACARSIPRARSTSRTNSLR